MFIFRPAVITEEIWPAQSSAPLLPAAIPAKSPIPCLSSSTFMCFKHFYKKVYFKKYSQLFKNNKQSKRKTENDLTIRIEYKTYLKRQLTQTLSKCLIFIEEIIDLHLQFIDFLCQSFNLSISNFNLVFTVLYFNNSIF